MSKAATRSAKPSALSRKYITRALPVGAVINCADNSGARTLKIVQVHGWKGRWSRLPAAAIGDKITIVVEKGPPELQKQTFPAIVIRQKYPVRRSNGLRIIFEDNAAVIITPEGELKGTGIKGPVASEAAEQWPRVANAANIIV